MEIQKEIGDASSVFYQPNLNFVYANIFEELNGFDFEMMYKPRKSTFLGKFFKEKDIPFPWVKINSGLDFEPNPDW